MRFGFTDEQEQFREVIRRFLRERSPTSDVRRMMATDLGYDRSLWEQLACEPGLTGLQVPENCGGQGFGFIELGIALEEMGAALLCAPYFASNVLATQALLHGATDSEQAELLPSIASGERIATLAWVEPSGNWDPAAIATVATARDDHYELNGTKKFVLDGHSADLILVAARLPNTHGDQGITLFAIERGSAGLNARLLQTIDATRKQAELSFTEVRARPLGQIGNAASALRRTVDEAAIALSCEMIGGARALLDSAVAYAKLRMQFGRPIGSFQAIKHKCAELLLDLELATSAARYAAAAVADNDANIPALASHAKAVVSDCYTRMASECIQIHGGIGFTWDQDTHLWFKRAKSSEVMLGDASFHRERYMSLVEQAA